MNRIEAMVTIAGKVTKAVTNLTDAIDRHTAAINRQCDLREEELT